MLYEIRRFSPRLLKGSWTRCTFDQARAGEIRGAVETFAARLPEGAGFVTVSAHDGADGFRFFLGVPDPEGNVCLPEGPYLTCVPYSEPWRTYPDIERLALTPRELFGGRRDADSLPVKIELFTASCHMTEIQIPLAAPE